MPPSCNEGQLLYITDSCDMSIDAVKLNLLLCLFFFYRCFRPLLGLSFGGERESCQLMMIGTDP